MERRNRIEGYKNPWHRCQITDKCSFKFYSFWCFYSAINGDYVFLEWATAFSLRSTFEAVLSFFIFSFSSFLHCELHVWAKKKKIRFENGIHQSIFQPWEIKLNRVHKPLQRKWFFFFFIKHTLYGQLSMEYFIFILTISRWLNVQTIQRIRSEDVINWFRCPDGKLKSDSVVGYYWKWYFCPIWPEK